MADLVHEVTIQISEGERRRASEDMFYADGDSGAFVDRVRAAAKLLPSTVMVGDMVQHVGGRGAFGEAAEVRAVEDGWAFIKVSGGYNSFRVDHLEVV